MSGIMGVVRDRRISGIMRGRSSFRIMDEVSY